MVKHRYLVCGRDITKKELEKIFGKFNDIDELNDISELFMFSYKNKYFIGELITDFIDDDNFSVSAEELIARIIRIGQYKEFKGYKLKIISYKG